MKKSSLLGKLFAKHEAIPKTNKPNLVSAFQLQQALKEKKRNELKLSLHKLKLKEEGYKCNPTPLKEVKATTPVKCQTMANVKLVDNTEIFQRVQKLATRFVIR